MSAGLRNYKITDKQMWLIVKRYRGGERAQTLADEFGITAKTVLGYVKNNGRKTGFNGTKIVSDTSYEIPNYTFSQRALADNYSPRSFNRKRDWIEED